MIYLFPRHMRLAQPAITAVKQDDHGFWLVTYHSLGYDHHFIPKEVNGTASAYQASIALRISEELYQALVAEAKKNQELYPEESQQREAELAGMVEQYKKEHGLS